MAPLGHNIGWHIGSHSRLKVRHTCRHQARPFCLGVGSNLDDSVGIPGSEAANHVASRHVTSAINWVAIDDGVGVPDSNDDNLVASRRATSTS